MNKSMFVWTCVILLTAQVVAVKFCNFSPFIAFSVLPLIIVALPLKVPTPVACVIAFVCGFVVDFFSSGSLGLSSIPLLVVAVLRIPIIRVVLSEDVTVSREDVPLRRLVSFKTVLVLLLSSTVYMTVFVWVDAAGTCQVWYNLVRILVSAIVDTSACYLLARLFFSDRIGI